MEEGKNGGEMVLIVAASLPSMLWKLFRSYLRMRRQARLAGENFYRSLVDGGVPPEAARKLCDEYTDAFRITVLMKGLMSSGK